MRTIRLTQGKKAKVDNADYERLASIKWYAQKIGNTFYTGNKRYGYMHRFIMGYPSDGLVDHINHDGLDNRKLNMRVVSQSQNQMNRASAPSNSTSGVRGVTWNKRDRKWRSMIVAGGKRKCLGSFNSIVDAIVTIRNANRAIYGDYGGNIGDERST